MLVAALPFGCSGADTSPTASTELGTEAPSSAEIFAREQEAIQLCMADAGFDDVSVTPVEETNESLYRTLLLLDADTNGYNALRHQLQLHLGSTGAPPEGLSPAQQIGYDRALIGDTMTQHDPDSEDPDAVLGGGCQAEGRIVRAQLESLTLNESGCPNSLNWTTSS